MTCEECQELLSDYVDGELALEDRKVLTAHLEECLDCFSVRDDLDSIVRFCEETRGQYDPVPNSRAMWARIRNAVEQESDSPGIEVTTDTAAVGGRHWWSRLGSRRMQLSFLQLSATVAAVAIIVSVATNAGLQRFHNSAAESNFASRQPQQSPSFTAPDDMVKQQSVALDYLNQRVELKKAKWSPQVRDAFERNLTALDRAVNDSRQQLIQNPHDEVSEEMFNAALNEKMQLLRDFSEQ